MKRMKIIEKMKRETGTGKSKEVLHFHIVDISWKSEKYIVHITQLLLFSNEYETQSNVRIIYNQQFCFEFV